MRDARVPQIFSSLVLRPCREFLGKSAEFGARNMRVRDFLKATTRETVHEMPDKYLL
jgi:hypothetical protein